MNQFSFQLFDPFAGITAFAKAVGAWLVSFLPTGAVRNFLGYWIYDLTKIVIILMLTTFILNLVRRVIGTGWLQRSLGRQDKLGMLSGAVLGVFTPVCSCSVTPLYASLLNSGASNQAAASFLFAAPAVNEFAIALVILALGFKGGLLYVALGIIAALITGQFAHKLGLEPCDLCNSPDSAFRFVSQQQHSKIQRFRIALAGAMIETWKLTRRLWWALVLGAGLAAVLVQFNLAPVQVMTALGHHPLAPVAAALIGLPLDVNAAAAGSILMPLVSAGLPIGTLISLMMAITVASFPEGAVLHRLIGWRGIGRLGAWYLVYTAGIGMAINALGRMVSPL